MRKAHLIGLLLAVAALDGCRCSGGGGVAVPRVLADCFETEDAPLVMTVTGTSFTGRPFSISGELTNPRDSTVVWMIPDGRNSGTDLDREAMATGELGEPDANGNRSLSATGTVVDGFGTEFTLRVTGTVMGPPPPCTASGRWFLGRTNGEWKIGGEDD